MITSLNRKNEHHDNICEELLRERAAVLSRAGMAVSDAIELLTRLDRQIKEKTSFLKVLNRDENIQNVEQNIQTIREEINLIIEQFNAACRKAQLQYYYLIVTREALGLRRHDRVSEIYKIPAEKEKIKVI
jgi:antitoxin component of RelBE/YafQ-DinJ toxin-antitoxin module